MESPRLLSSKELKSAALQKLISSRVDSRMIRHLASATETVIPCDKNMMPAPPRRPAGSAALPTPPTTPELRAVSPADPTLPTLEQFIRRLVESSNVQAATLLPALVYLYRLRDRLQPMSRGLRCTSHRIFLACLVLAAKFVNDISPKNKHWARYTTLETPAGHKFGFCTSEVNLMEKQLLQLLDWDLRVEEAEMVEAWGAYMAPVKEKIEYENRLVYHSWCREHARRSEARVPAQAPPAGPYYAPHVAAYPSPTYSRGASLSPPELSYDGSSSASSTSSRGSSRATTPGSAVSVEHAAVYTPSYEYPREHRKRLLPYEIAPEQAVAREGRSKIPRGSHRGVFSRVFGGAMMAR